MGPRTHPFAQRAIALAALLLAALAVLLAAGAGARASSRTAWHSFRTRSHHHPHHHSTCARRASYHASGHHRHRSHAPRCAARRRHVTHKHHAHPHSVPHRSSTAGACDGAGATPSPADIQLLREAILCLVNRERAAHGEAALATSAQLQQAAQQHSDSMSAHSYFDHVGPGGDTPLSRMRASGYLAGAAGFEVGENIAWGSLWLGTPRAIFEGWMASPGHRENILDARFRDTAIGVSADLPGALGHGLAGAIYTQDFGVRLHG